MKLSIKDFLSKSFLRIWSHLLKKSLIENLLFCAVYAFVHIETNLPTLLKSSFRFVWWMISQLRPETLC